MDDIPAPELFEPAPDEPRAGGRLRRRFQVAVTVTLVAALVALAAVEGGGYLVRGDGVDSTKAQPPAVPRIAAVDSAGALTTMDGRGGSVVEHSVPGVSFQFPAWSPDGSRIAALGQGSNGTGVYVFAARSAADASIAPIVVYESAESPPFYLYWTSDGRELSFLTTEAEGLSLRIAPADSNATVSIVRAGAPMYWDFVDPGRLLIHSGTTGANGFLGEVGADGAPIDGTGATPGVFRAPAVSADGRYRAFLAAGDGASSAVVLEARDGSGATRIPVFGPAAVSFSPQADALAFVAPDQPNSGDIPLPVGPLRLLQPQATEARTLLGGSVVSFFWSPTGKEIAVLLIENPSNPVTQADRGGDAILAKATVATGGAATEGPAAREAAAGLPLHLAFVDVASGSIRSERVVRVSDLFVNQVLPFFDQYALSHHVWSSDGTSIVLPIVGDADITQLTVIPSDGSTPTVVATAEMGFWSP